MMIDCFEESSQFSSLALLTMDDTSSLLFKIPSNKSILRDKKSSTDLSFLGLKSRKASGLLK